jgi:RNA polymerase sigma-70 factor (ECF subfamily)
MSELRTNQEWRQALESTGELQNAAIEDLRVLLRRAAAYTFQRNLGDLSTHNPDQIQQLAEDCAQEALLAILKNLSGFRGESKFTTWAYKFAVNISLTMLRRERWKGVSLDDLAGRPEQPEWFWKESPGSDPDLAVLRGEIREIISRAIRDELTEKQRLVLKWMVFDEVPMDVVLQHLNTNRNAVYKLLHDARRKLKLGLQSRGIGIDETIDLFGGYR